MSDFEVKFRINGKFGGSIPVKDVKNGMVAKDRAKAILSNKYPDKRVDGFTAIEKR